ncbi:MAG TPA: DNA-binding domain-containing protein [Gallionella sp.]|nr:DNA-binding domain-containing protein [Gallionella sp.]
MPALSKDLSDFAGAIVRGDGLPVQIETAYPHYSISTAIEVYRNNYRGNLHDTLAGAYPVIAQLVGAEFFRYLTRHFIAQHPSRSGNLHRYGAEMGDFVASFKPAGTLPYLPDVAALEWACHRAYFAEDAHTLDIARLAQIPAEHYPDLILRTHPSCHLVRSRYPVVTIWHAHQPGAADDFQIDLDSGASIALVSRRDDVVIVNESSAADAGWLQAIQAGTQLGEATAAALEQHPDFDLQAALLNLVAQGVLTDINFGENS